MSALLAVLFLASSLAPGGSPSLSKNDPGSVVDRLATRTGELPRDRQGLVVPLLARLGPSALPAILARIDSPSPAMRALAGSHPSAARLFREALVEAAADSADPRALPTLEAIFESGSDDARLVRSAADGLGKQCDAAFDRLAAHAEPADALALAASSGLGHCREGRSLALLVDELAAATDGPTMKALAEDLGFLASSWAWQALGPTRAEEGRELRAAAAKALLHAYLRAPPPAREALAESLVMTDDPLVRRALADPRFAGLRPLWRRAHL